MRLSGRRLPHRPGSAGNDRVKPRALPLLALLATLLAATSSSAAEASVAGAVARPGKYPLTGDRGVVGLILAAGGLAPGGCTEVTVLGRVEGRSRLVRVNLWELLAGFTPDAALADGDQVIIPSHEEPCLREAAAFNALLKRYLKARAQQPTPPAGWAQELFSLPGGCGKRHAQAAR